MEKTGRIDARLPWVWIMEVFSHANRKCRQSDQTLALVHERCLNAVGAIGDGLAYLDGKLPIRKSTHPHTNCRASSDRLTHLDHRPQYFQYESPHPPTCPPIHTSKHIPGGVSDRLTYLPRDQTSRTRLHLLHTHAHSSPLSHSPRPACCPSFFSICPAPSTDGQV